MNKKGFTLTELLVVIAIIGVLSVIIIPSVVKVNKGINEREYEQRKSYIQTAAEMYATDKPDIFAGGDVAYVYVWQLLNEQYLEADAEYGDASCAIQIVNGTETALEDGLSVGCVVDPRYSASLNYKQVKLTRKTVGIVAELVDDGEVGDPSGGSDALVNKICEGFSKKLYSGAYGDPNNPQSCGCGTGKDSDGIYNSLVLYDSDNKPTGTSVDYCIIKSRNANGNVDNWLKYGSSSANWRVMGLYKIDGEVVAKMITSGVVD